MEGMRLSVCSLALAGFGWACSSADASVAGASGAAGQTNLAGGGGYAEGAADAAGTSGAGDKAGSSAASGQSGGGSSAASGQSGRGGSAASGQSGGGGTGGAGSSVAIEDASEYADLYKLANTVCRSRSADVELKLTGIMLNGLGFQTHTFEDVVVGDMRHLKVGDLGDASVLSLTWPASASGGVEVEASGVLVSTSEPEVNVCFEGKAIVAKDRGKGELFHLVASRNARVANADGTCTDTALTGTVTLCTANQKYGL